MSHPAGPFGRSPREGRASRFPRPCRHNLSSVRRGCDAFGVHFQRPSAASSKGAWLGPSRVSENTELLDFFRAELARLAGPSGKATFEAVGKRIGYHADMVSKVARGVRDPTEEFADALDKGYPQYGGMFRRVVDTVKKRQGLYRSWFRGWVDGEERASLIRWWEPLQVPGLLQTEGYARALFSGRSAGLEEAEIESGTQGRMKRQAIFDRTEPRPPAFRCVIKETVLFESIGGSRVMYGQLQHLAERSERPRVTIQVVPATVGEHMSVGLLGAFAVAEFEDSETVSIAYMETPDEGQTSKYPGTVSKLIEAFDSLRGEALSASESRDMILTVAEERWKH
jgi:hypothetical protein